jgi:transposase-like protein
MPKENEAGRRERLKAEVKKRLLTHMSIRAIERITGIHRDTVMRL